MAKESSLPPSLRAHLYDRPQEPQGLSPTASSPGAQDEGDFPAPPFAPPRPSAFPRPPIAPPTLSATFSDPRRQYSGYESGALDPIGLHSPTGLPPPDRVSSTSSIPHGSARRYRDPAGSDPVHPAAAVRQAPAAYPGSVSLPTLSQITAAPSHWREGEAGPSSLVHSPHSYGALRRPSPNYPLPQGIYRRATEPGSYASESGFTPPAFERLREQVTEGYPSRPSSGHPYGEASSSRLSLPPLFTQRGEPVELPPLYSALQSQSSSSSDFTRIDDGESRGVKRHFPHDFEVQQRSKIPRKILVACDFCRGRKLRCDGNRPTCANCVTRDMTCLYRLEPKRRGPGKAAKGSRTKRRATKQGRHSDPSARSADDGFQLAPELRPQRSMDSGFYSSQATLVERYDSRQLSPEWTADERRSSRSRRDASSDYYSPPSESESRG